MTASPLTRLWALAALAATTVLVLALAPPWLAPGAAGAVDTSFSWICHQLPERTLHVHGTPVALCHRCLGLLAGLVGGIALAPVAPRAVRRLVDARRQARVLLVAALPVVVDWTLGATGLWLNTPLSRSATGALFGLAAGAMIGVALLAGPALAWNGDAHAA